MMDNGRKGRMFEGRRVSPGRAGAADPGRMIRDARSVGLMTTPNLLIPLRFFANF